MALPVRARGCLAGPGWEDGVRPGGGCSRWEQWLPPLTSTGGQCNTEVPPDCSAPHTLQRPWGSGMRVSQLHWDPCGQAPGQGDRGCRAPCQSTLLVFFVILILEFQKELTGKGSLLNTERTSPFPFKALDGAVATLVTDPSASASTWEVGPPRGQFCKMRFQRLRASWRLPRSPMILHSL